jgi:hypothetical protein
MSDQTVNRQFPIGKFAFQDQYSPAEIDALIRIIADSPAEYKSAVTDLSDEDLSKTYREGSWNVRQLVHHVADIQLLHYFRMKKAVTEADRQDTILIDMNAWAMTADSVAEPIADSLIMFEGITARYMSLAKTLTEEQFSKSYYHTVRQLWFTQHHGLAISAWHVKHHLAHIRLALG